MVHLGTRRDVSVLCLVLTLAIYFRDAACLCEVDCAGSGGDTVGSKCKFEFPEELPVGTVLISLQFSKDPCDEPALADPANPYLEISGTNISMKTVLDYDENEDDLPDPFFVEVECPSETCTGGSLAVEFENINDNNITTETTSSTAQVAELITYKSDEAIEVNPAIRATDKDVESFLSYTIEDDQSNFELLNADTGEAACFPTYIQIDVDDYEINTATPILVVKEDGKSFNYAETPTFKLTVLVQSFMEDNGCTEGVVENITFPLTINVQDLDDQPPTFNDTVYNCTVEEHSLEFIEAPYIYAFDQDEGIDATLYYSLEQDGKWDCSSYVDIEESSGIVSIVKEFDFDQDDQVCKLTLTATQEDNPRRVAIASLEINILNVNDICPEIKVSSKQGTYINGDSFVSDDTSSGWLILNVTDADPILNFNGPEIDSTFFDLQRISCDGVCFLISPNETTFESMESENITVSVTDTLYNSTSCQFSVTIEIFVPEDTEILNPYFTLPEYSGTIEENEIGHLLKVTALNGDGTDEEIEYSLSGPEEVFFSINETGHINVLLGLDYETKPTHLLTVKAIDGRWNDVERSSTVEVTVEVMDVNDNNPALEGFPLFLYVSEGTPPNTVITTLQATDRDAGSNLTYHFDTTPTNFPFTLNSDTGGISTSGSLDADTENGRQYNATVVVSDGENTIEPEDLVITILDVNDNPPIISSNTQFVLDISENDDGPKTLLINVTDGDFLVENQDYTLTSDEGSNVTINQAAGEVLIHGPFDREVLSEFRFTLTVTNTASPSLETSETVVVSILDENDEAPTFTYETELYCSQLTVTEETPYSEPLCTFSATDDDEIGSKNSEITYEVENGEYSDHFEMNDVTGELDLTKVFDREDVSNISITVVASDNGVPQNSDSMVVNVAIEGINDNRPFFKTDGDYSTTVHEETTPNTLILNITADDIDVPTPDPIYYRPADETDQVWETFYLKSENGECEIYLKSVLNAAESLYELEIETYDGDGSPSYKEGTDNRTIVIVEVEPRIPCDITIDEEYRESRNESDLSNFETIVDVNASSSCSESEDGIVYSIEDQILRPVAGGETESTFFTVDPESGEIYAEDVTNVEIGMYVLTVSAKNETVGSDVDQNEDSVQVYINVTDANNQCPYFEETEYLARYTEGDRYLSSFSSPDWLVVTAIDDDTKFIGEVMFSDDTKFAENTTELSSKRSFLIAVNDGLSTDTTLNITVSDDTSVVSCKPSLTTIYISVEEYLSPVFLNETYMTFLDENPQVGDPVIQVTAQNSDGTTEDISYAIENPSNTPFMIDIQSGEIVVAFEGVDYEAVKDYNLTVSATDNRWDVARSSVTQVLIEIEDVNEFTPELLGLPAKITIQESVENGSEVFLLKGSDGDTDDNENLTYKLLSGGENKFAVDSKSGSVYTDDTIDFEEGDRDFSLIVSVSDGIFESSSELTIMIQDVNDNAPKFDPTSFSENITENQSPSYIYVVATDDDEMDTISYTLAGNYPNGASFNETGFVKFTEIFDRELQDYYSFFVIASDGTYETSAVIEISVLDENDEYPKFVSLCDGKVDIEESEPADYLVCTISAEDADAPESTNSLVTYSLLDDDGGPFGMEPSTGEIFLTGPLNYETTESFTLIVQAGDGVDGSENKVNGSLEVSVIDVNDNPPVFENHPSTISLIFDLAVGSEVTNLLVSDADKAPYDSFRCVKNDSSDASWDTFYVTTMKDGCSVMLGSSLNTSTEYTIRVTAVDFTDDSLTSSTQFVAVVSTTYPCQITLEVEDVQLDKTEVASRDRVADVQATSNCSDSEDGIMFSILTQQLTSPLGDKNEQSEEFSISKTNGTIFYAGSTEYPSVGNHSLVVEAVNGTDDALRAQTQLLITIKDVDVSDPEFPDPPQIPGSPDPSLTSVFVGRFDEGDEYVYNYIDTRMLVISASDNDTCFSGNVKVLDPSSTPFYLEEQSSGSCVESFEAYLRVNGTVEVIPDITTFQIILFDGENIEAGIGNVTVAKVSLSPVFQGSLMATVMENANVGDNVTKVLALNNDDTVDGIQYEIEPPTTYFELKEAKSGIITVKSIGIDYESSTFYNISLSAHDTRWSPRRTTSTTLGVSVIDENEFEPELFPFPSISLQENVALANATIYKIQAFDSDASSSLEYYLVNNSDTFEVNKDSGDVTLVSSIDAETDPLLYYVNVNVTDGIYVDSGVLFVKITDFNEFPPNITGESVVEMYENDTSAMLQVTAIDPDISRLSIVYSIDPSDSIASIDENGTITFQGSLNYADQSSYSFIVTAEEDDGMFSSALEVTLVVLDINDHDPELVLDDCPTQNEVLEGPDSVSTLICTLSATDQDAEMDTSFTYFLLNSYEDTFQLDAKTGELTVIAELDREIPGQDDYTLEVLVNDGGNPSRNSSISTITLRVGDANDNPPKFVSLPTMPVSVAEGSEAGTIVAKLTVMDYDAFPYNISRCERTDPTDTVWNNFTILNDRVGYCDIITIAVLSDPLAYILYVTAIDLNEENLSDSVSLRVQVITDDDCQLTISIDSPLKFDEDQLVPGSEVTTVNVSSLCSDSIDDITFEIVEQTLQHPNEKNEDVLVFEIDETGVISVIPSANVSLGQYTLIVSAYNTSSPLSRDTDGLVIIVNDINNNCPAFLLEEDDGIYAQNDTFIYDTESSARLVILADDPDLEFIGNFAVNSTDIEVVQTETSGGTVELQLSIVSTLSGNVTVQVTLVDASISCLSDVINIYIYKIPVQELSPIFLDPSSFSGIVWENATSGTNVTQVRAVDYNGDTDGITYNFAEEDSHFKIDPTLGVITTGDRGLDYETENRYLKLVLASDEKWDPPRISEIYVIIEVLDVDEYPLELAQIPVLNVPENSPNDTLVYIASATDADGSSNFTFVLDDSMNKFYIDAKSGEIYTMSNLDAEDSDNYNMTVTVTEESSLQSESQVVQVFISDVNDLPPEFDTNEYSEEVFENFEGIKWFMVYATDDDLTPENNMISYSLQDIDDPRFSIDSKGNITIDTEGNPFDREDQGSYQFRVIATDNGKPTLSASARVSVIVNDVNETPVFSDSLPKSVTFEENKAGLIATFQATDNDADDNGKIVYSVEAVDSKSEGLFNINDDGELFAVQPLDREDVATHSLDIYATDSGSPPLNTSIMVTVNVSDVNDNAPVFQPPFETIVDSSLPVGSEILQISATDKDEYPNDAIIFSPANSSSDVWKIFTLQANDDGATIISISEFDVEFSQIYNLDIKASNPGSINVETQEYTVVVNDGTLCFVTVEIPSDGTEKKKQGDLEQNEVFLQLNATSSEGCDEEDEFIFVLNSQVYSGFEDTEFVDDTTFYLSPEGDLSPVVVTVETGEYQLKVVAVNKTDPTDQLSISESLLTIVVVGDFNSPPSFDEDYSRNIRLPKEIDEFLFQLSADDPDDANSGNNQLVFEKLSESGSSTGKTYFRVEADGEVYAASNLLANDIVDLTVQVTDSGIPPLSDNTTIQIKLTMDAAPILETLCDEVVYIMENATMGTPVCDVVSKGEEDISFSLTSGKEAFVIDENGAIKTNYKFDYEDTQDYQVVVNAEGLDTKLNSTTQILVKITDINEYPPVLLDNYFFVLLEDSGNLSCESDFGFIMATDEDGSEDNSFTSYSLEGDDRFVIDVTEGVISKIACIDVDKPSENSTIMLTVRAENSKADPMLHDTAVVSITIKDLNDKPPELILDGPQDIVREEFIEEEELFVFHYSDDDITAINRDSIYNFEPSEEGVQEYFEFNEEEGKISTTTTSPPLGTDVAILVTIINRAEPMLSSSMTVFYSYREGSYFPDELLTQSVNVEENDDGTVETDIPGPVGSLSTTRYSVFNMDGRCAEDIKVEYKSNTFLKLSTTALDFEDPDRRVFNITIAFASDEDDCAVSKRKKRQANVLAVGESSLVTINLVNVNDESPSFTEFPFGSGSTNFYQAIHVSRVVGETVYDLSQDAGKVEDLDGMPTTLTYNETGENDLVNVLSDGSVILKKFLSNGDADGKTHDVNVEVVDSEQGGSDAANLRLRVMADKDIFMLWFNWPTDSQDQDQVLLQCVKDCFPEDVLVSSERVVKSESQNSALWLYAVNGQDIEDFMTRQEFVKTWDANSCSTNCDTGKLIMESVGWTPLQIAVFTLAVLIFVGAVIFILVLLYSYRVYEQERERRMDIQEATSSTESEDSFRPVAVPLVRGESIFDKIAREKNTTLYGSDEAILDLISEADGPSFDGKLVMEVDIPPNGDLKVGATEEADTDDGDLLDPYSTFHFDPTNKNKTSSKESGQVVLKEATANSETSTPDDILAGYDNIAFENDEKSPSKDPAGAGEPRSTDNVLSPRVTIQHGGGETSTDALSIHQTGEKSDPGNGSRGSVGSGADVTPAIKEASDEAHAGNDANDISLKDANNDSQKHGDDNDRQNGVLDERLHVTAL